MKLSKPSIEALKLVAEHPRETWRYTLHGWISGRTAASLQRKGLVKFVAKTPDSWEKLVVITPEGSALLKTYS